MFFVYFSRTKTIISLINKELSMCCLVKYDIFQNLFLQKQFVTVILMEQMLRWYISDVLLLRCISITHAFMFNTNENNRKILN